MQVRLGTYNALEAYLFRHCYNYIIKISKVKVIYSLGGLALYISKDILGIHFGKDLIIYALSCCLLDQNNYHHN